jgi:hypothetical protein
MTRAHVRLLGPCFKTGQADHAFFRLQYSQTVPEPSSPTIHTENMLRLPVHISKAQYSSESLTAYKGLLAFILTTAIAISYLATRTNKGPQ